MYVFPSGSSTSYLGSLTSASSGAAEVPQVADFCCCCCRSARVAALLRYHPNQSCPVAGRLHFVVQSDDEGRLFCVKEAACVPGFAVRWVGELSVLWDGGNDAEQVDLGALEIFGVRQQFEQPYARSTSHH